MRWPGFEVLKKGNRYVRRFELLVTPWFRVYMHNICQTDERALHDHSSSFYSLILSGGYEEECGYQRLGFMWRRTWKRWSWHFMPAMLPHRITQVQPGTWTLCFAGAKKRQWGFHTKNGWVANTQYLHADSET